MEESTNLVKNIKTQFANWLIHKAPNSYKNYLGDNKDSVISKLEEIDAFFPSRELFQVSKVEVEKLKSFIINNITHKEGRLRNREFYRYDKQNSNGIPRAILGRKNYFKFLDEKFSKTLSNMRYTQEEKKKLKQFYNDLEDKHSFQDWLLFASIVIRDLNIDHEKFRAAITRENEAMLLIGMKPIFTFKNQEGKTTWGFILSEEYFQKNESSLPVFKVSNFAEANNKKHALVRLYLNTFRNLTPDFLDDFIACTKAEYEYSSTTKFKNWNQEASTTNNALKEVIYKDEIIENWFKDIKQINLNSHKLYKLSMGTFYKSKKFRDKKIVNEILFRSIGVMHEQTGLSQGDRFKKEAEVGDYVYVTYGKDKLDGLYQIKSGYEKLDEPLEKLIDEEGYIARQLEKVKSPLQNHTRDLKEDTRSWMPSGNTTFVEITDLSEANKTLFKPYYDVEFTRNGEVSENRVIDFTENKFNYPLNQILYGPPGTGKTYKTKSLAVYIVNPDFSASGSNEMEKRKSIVLEYDRLFENGQIVFTTFHQSFGYEDFVEGIKPNTTEDKKVIYDVAPGVFKKLCEKAKNNWLEFNKGQANGLSFDEAFAKLKEEWEENENISFPLKTQGKDYKIIGFTESSIQFEKASGGTGHSLSISTLRDAYYNRKEIRSTGVGIYYPGILNKLKSYHSEFPDENTPSNRENLRNYVLVIDEINRGNVSGIFGELITLLEPDKRMSREEEISVELPYSKEQFTVPPNVYIIGTMNTADRSVEALDTALRRRFAFEEMIPKPELLKDIIFNGFNLKEVLTTINERIEALVDRDHTIGHSYFINIESGVAEALKHAFENKVIPLLQEYFYNDYEKIALVLGEGFVEKKKSDITFAYPGIEAPEIVESYKLKNVNDIENAVHILLNKKSEESK
ncbi:McrB family protein [Salegentibacter mishustinae]|uniref:AAA+ ATPase domain-containing protein n=1 Tax=Salegentibacter mishustinae TaxID=270918 RepID=A0A0Q9ZKU1_9FLAO|nr:AAA family ATPase [Salegentibacter mishustinae]KRG29032.1 hypothetical protein APR42_03645 [Salegentibacter mishustinae]PNW21916.1 hypothetical protein APB85_11845 [Salegentibacter mishustinae]PZX65267.1 dynein-related subfamily AAA family protein [Salegentibacter mishustinae]GGW86216.1 hypothetical protein GCM10008086_13160 [Salegentibacter mishustinae]